MCVNTLHVNAIKRPSRNRAVKVYSGITEIIFYQLYKLYTLSEAKTTLRAYIYMQTYKGLSAGYKILDNFYLHSLCWPAEAESVIAR